MKKSPPEPKVLLVFSLFFWNPEEVGSKTSGRIPQKNIHELDSENKRQKGKAPFSVPFICVLPPKGKVQI